MLVVYASPLDQINSSVVEHFTQRQGQTVPVVRLDLAGDSRWFSKEVRASLGTSHGAFGAYYLFLAGRMVRAHSGFIDNEFTLLAFAAASRSSEMYQQVMRQKAAAIIVEFEPAIVAHLARAKGRKKPPARKRDPHETLGIRPGASAKEIDTAHRQRIKECHPDQVANMDPAIRQVAERLTVEINAARDELRRGR